MIANNSRAAGLCDDFVCKPPNLKRSLCAAAQLQATAARSVKGQTLWMRDVKPDNARQRVLVIGAIHGDELSSASVALHGIRLAEETAAPWSQATHWRFIPALNPDGLLATPPRRVNANGVDLKGGAGGQHRVA